MKFTKFRNLKPHTFKYRLCFLQASTNLSPDLQKVVQMINGHSFSYSCSFFFVCISAFMCFQADRLSMASLQPLGSY